MKRALTKSLAAAVSVALAPLLASCATVNPTNIEAIRAGSQGYTQETAIKVSSVKQEYETVRALGFEVQSQSLAMPARKAYDILTVRDPASGEVRKLWFDVSSFFGSY